MSTSIGRAKTVLVLGDGDDATAVISAVVARPLDEGDGERLRFAGPVVFSPNATKHIEGVVFPLVCRVLGTLCVEPMSFEVSLVNLGAASSADLGINVSGYSADVPVLLALLSAGLGLRIPQDLVSTGHLASSDGDIAAVRALPAKVAASVADDTVHRFVYPAHTQDESLETLTPGELRRIHEAIVEASDRIRTIAVGDVAELVQTVFDDETIVLGGLRRGFFKVSPSAGSASGVIDRTVRFLAHGNEDRFLTALERRLLAGESDEAGELLQAWVAFHIERRTYPATFGFRLLQLARSLPPAVRRLKTMFPLLPTSACIALSQFAAESDHEDVRLLYDAASGSNVGHHRVGRAADAPVQVMTGDDAPTALDAVLTELDPRHLASSIGLPVDTARATFTLNAATVESYDEFLDAVSAFYLHLLRHTRTVVAPVNARTAAGDAQKLVEQTFQRQGGVKAALAEARDGTRGGMRFVLDAMADCYKRDEITKYVNMILEQAIDPKDWDTQVAFAAALLKRLGPHLPPEIRCQPAERFAEQYKLMAQAYVRSFEQVHSLLRTL